MLGTLATLQSDAVVNAAPVLKEDKGASKARGKMGRGEKAQGNYAIDLYGTNEGDEDASVDKFEGPGRRLYSPRRASSRVSLDARRGSGAADMPRRRRRRLLHRGRVRQPQGGLRPPRGGRQERRGRRPDVPRVLDAARL